MNASGVSMAIHPVDLRELAREWIAETITKHLALQLADVDRIRNIAAAIEDEAHEQNMPIELAVTMAADWAHEENERADLSYASDK
jgi:hypothetical protein